MPTTVGNLIKATTTLLAVLCLSIAMVLIVSPGKSAAYEGAFCAEISVAEGVGCESVERDTIRRAIGHTDEGYTDVGIETKTEALLGYCRSPLGCEASTGYLNKDGNGKGIVFNEGPNGRKEVSGYLYP